MSAIFLSHSSKDNAMAQQIAAWLKERKFDSLFLDFDPQVGIPAGRDWKQELYHQLRRCRAVIVLCSEHSVASEWCVSEVAIASNLGKSLFPILIGPCNPFKLLSDRQITDFTGNLEEGYQRLARGLEQAGLDPRDIFQWDAKRPPYPGLTAFQEADAGIFFGREEAISEGLDALQKLRTYGGKGLLMVLGASGSGKSSLVRAGLVPRLRRDTEAWLVLDPFRPRADPFAELAIVLAAAFDRQGQARDCQAITDQLRASAAEGSTAGAALRQQLEELRLLTGNREATAVVTIDQFEELLAGAGSAQAEGSPEANRFLAFLRTALEPADGRLVVLGTLRSDFLGTLQGQPALRDLPFDQLLVGPLGAGGYTRIIEGPAEVAGLKLEAGLSERMVQETETGDARTGDALPLLAYTLWKLWEDYGRDDGDLTLAEYTILGGLVGSVQRAADGVFKAQRISEAQENDLRQAFLAMTRLNEQSQYSRKPARWEEMPPGSRETLQRFVDARLLVSGKEKGTIEVAHEALLRNWPKLKGWLDGNREFLLWHQRLDDALAEYDQSQTLLRDKQLAEAERWRDTTGKDSKERKLIDASLMARKRQRLRNRSLQGIVTAVILAAGGYSFVQWQNTRAALAQGFEAQHRALLDSDPMESVVNGLAAMRRYANEPGVNFQLSQSLQGAVDNNLSITHPIPTGQGMVRSLIELKNGELISGGKDGSLRRWRDGQAVGAAIATGQGTVWSLIELKNGELISGGADGSLRRWRDGKAVGAAIDTGQGAVLSLIELKNGELISGGNDGRLRRWRDGKAVGAAIDTGQGPVLSLIELKNGELISGGKDGSLRRWRDGQPVGAAIPTDQGPVRSLIELKNGELISGGGGGSLRRWRDGQAVGAAIATGQGGVLGLIELKNGELISGGGGGSLRRWRHGKAVGAAIATGQGWVWSLIELKNGELVSGGGDGSLRRWRHGKAVGAAIATGLSEVLSLIELKNGELISGGKDGRLRRWRHGKAVGAAIDTGQGPVLSLIELKNGELISGGKDGSLRLWRHGKAVGAAITTGQRGVWSLIELKNGELISGGKDGSLRRWRDGQAVGAAIDTGQRGVWSLIELKNGELISGGADGSLRRWRDGKAVGTAIATDQGAVRRLIELKNGELISGGQDGNLRRWRDGKAVGAAIATGLSEVLSLIELKNGELISGGQDGTLKIFSAPRVTKAACEELRELLLDPDSKEPAENEAREFCKERGYLSIHKPS